MHGSTMMIELRTYENPSFFSAIQGGLLPAVVLQGHTLTSRPARQQYYCVTALHAFFLHQHQPRRLS